MVLQTKRGAAENIQIENIQEAESAKVGSTWRGRGRFPEGMFPEFL